jgi:Leucine-rich repeat (LRR) protein
MSDNENDYITDCTLCLDQYEDNDIIKQIQEMYDTSTYKICGGCLKRLLTTNYRIPTSEEIIKKSIDSLSIDSLSITELDLSDKQISDISYLSSFTNLTNLTKLNLSRNKIVDLSPLATLTNLTHLNLSDNDIADSLKFISHLKNLKTLRASYSGISDIFPLATLVNLTELHLYCNLIVDIEPLKHLRNLTRVDLGKNNIDTTLLHSFKQIKRFC